jgi:hypothetical protein
MSDKGYDGTVGGWERLLAAVREDEKLFAAGESQWAALAFRLEEVKEAKERQQIHSAGRQRATRDLDHRLAAGSDAAIRLQSLVKSHLGHRDERLPQFGVKPRGARKGTSSRPEPPSFALKGSEQAK